MSPAESAHPKLRLFWKFVSISIGGLLILAGLVMLVTPGPGWLLIFAGLAMLSPHSRRARRITTWLKDKLRIHRKQPEGKQAGGVSQDSEDRDRRARM